MAESCNCITQLQWEIQVDNVVEKQKFMYEIDNFIAFFFYHNRVEPQINYLSQYKRNLYVINSKSYVI
jgi:hypothetical protein